MVFLQPVHQIPETVVSVMAFDDAIVIEHFDPVQQSHELVPDFRIRQQIGKNIRAESADFGIRRQAGHHPLQQRNFMRLLRDLFHDGIHSEVMPGIIRNDRIGYAVLIREKNAQTGLGHASRLHQKIRPGITFISISERMPVFSAMMITGMHLQFTIPSDHMQ